MTSQVPRRFMRMKDGNVLDEHTQYRIIHSPDESVLLFDWKPTPGLAAADFAQGITAFAEQCRRHNPQRAVIDAQQLDQQSSAVKWLRGQGDLNGEDYRTWWAREIVPRYQEAKIAVLTVATGDPNAPGRIPSPDGAGFAIGYFTDLKQAMNWAP